jgi:hypothetical protein
MSIYGEELMIVIGVMERYPGLDAFLAMYELFMMITAQLHGIDTQYSIEYTAYTIILKLDASRVINVDQPVSL